MAPERSEIHKEGSEERDGLNQEGKKKMKTAKEMTDAELSQAARRYDDGMNEGGEGYNPYREEISRRDHDRAVAEHAAKRQTPEGKIEALQKRIRTECGSVAREWGNTEEIDKLQRDLYAQIDALKAEMDAEFAKVWTREETIARRTAWNDMVKAGKFGAVGGDRVDYVCLRMLGRAYNKQVREQGWDLDDLKRAVKLHNLGGGK